MNEFMSNGIKDFTGAVSRINLNALPLRPIPTVSISSNGTDVKLYIIIKVKVVFKISPIFLNPPKNLLRIVLQVLVVSVLD